MSWQVYAILNVVLSALRGIESGRLGRSKKDMSLVAMTVSFAIVFVLGIGVVILRGEPLFHAAAREHWFFLLGSGFLFTTLNLLFLYLFRRVQTSVAVLLSLLNPLAVVVFAVLFASEQLSLQQWAGAGAVLAGVCIAGFVSPKAVLHRQKPSRSAVLAVGLSLGIALLYGLAVINEKYLLQTIGLSTYIVYGIGSQLLFALGYAFVFRKQFHWKISSELRRSVIRYGFFLATAGLFFLHSIHGSGSAALPAIIASAKVALTVVLAYILLKERDHLQRKTLSLCVSIIGLVLLL